MYRIHPTCGLTSLVTLFLFVWWSHFLFHSSSPGAKDEILRIGFGTSEVRSLFLPNSMYRDDVAFNLQRRIYEEFLAAAADRLQKSLSINRGYSKHYGLKGDFVVFCADQKEVRPLKNAQIQSVGRCGARRSREFNVTHHLGLRHVSLLSLCILVEKKSFVPATRKIA